MLAEKQIKRIYDSGPLSLIQKGFAVLSATTCFALGFVFLWLMILCVAQAGLQLGAILAAPFIGFMAFLLLLLGVGLVYPVSLGYSTRVHLNGSEIEVERPYPFHLLRKVIDRDRINSMEVSRQRKGGYLIFVLYLFDESGPKISDSDTIGPFYNEKQAHAVAEAIQAELPPNNRNESNCLCKLRSSRGIFRYSPLLHHPGCVISIERRASRLWVRVRLGEVSWIRLESVCGCE